MEVRPACPGDGENCRQDHLATSEDFRGSRLEFPLCSPPFGHSASAWRQVRRRKLAGDLLNQSRDVEAVDGPVQLARRSLQR